MRATISVLLIFTGFVFSSASAKAATPQVLWNFCTAHFCTDGAHPTAGVIVDKYGDAFGTTAGDLQSDPNGDPHKSTLFGVGPGVALFNNNPQATFYRLVEFCSAVNCTDGAQAASNIIGTVAITTTPSFFVSVTGYGTTVTGGANNGGAIFKATLTTHQAIYSFCNKTDSFSSCADGSAPGDIVQDSSGNIYGTTQRGGANATSPNGAGVLYKFDPKLGVLTRLYSFCSLKNCTDGVQPYGRQLAIHKNVNNGDDTLYGTTYTGGKFNSGVVFRFDLVTKKFDVIYDFCKRANCVDGRWPQAGVTFDPVTGNLFGVTAAGGKGDKGVLYTITSPDGAVGDAQNSFLLMKLFCSAGGSCIDGAGPGWAPIPDGAANLVGATYGGGASGAGTIYELTDIYTNKVKYNVLYSFCPGGKCDTGAYPEGSLTLFPAAKSGQKVTPWTTIYGVTIYGGANNGVSNGGGTVFKLTP